MTTPTLKERVCADLAAGEPYLSVATRHRVHINTATKWFAASGLTRVKASTDRPLPADKRRRIERLLAIGERPVDVMRVCGCTRKTVMVVKAAMEASCG